MAGVPHFAKPRARSQCLGNVNMSTSASHKSTCFPQKAKESEWAALVFVGNSGGGGGGWASNVLTNGRLPTLLSVTHYDHVRRKYYPVKPPKGPERKPAASGRMRVS